MKTHLWANRPSSCASTARVLCPTMDNTSCCRSRCLDSPKVSSCFLVVRIGWAIPRHSRLLQIGVRPTEAGVEKRSEKISIAASSKGRLTFNVPTNMEPLFNHYSAHGWKRLNSKTIQHKKSSNGGELEASKFRGCAPEVD